MNQDIHPYTTPFMKHRVPLTLDHIPGCVNCKGGVTWMGYQSIKGESRTCQFTQLHVSGKFHKEKERNSNFKPEV